MNECRNEKSKFKLVERGIAKQAEDSARDIFRDDRMVTKPLSLSHLHGVLGSPRGWPFPNRMESPVVLLTYYSQSTTEAFPTPDLQIPVRSFLSPARWGTVAGFPHWDLFCIKQESTNKHNAQHRENAFSASCYDSGHYREVIFNLWRHFSEANIAAIGGVFILTLPFHPWRIIC